MTIPPDTKSAAEAYVKDVEGVTRVINNIKALPLSPNDDRLRQTLYREIYSGPPFRYQVGSLQSIHISARRSERRAPSPSALTLAKKEPLSPRAI